MGDDDVISTACGGGDSCNGSSSGSGGCIFHNAHLNVRCEVYDGPKPEAVSTDRIGTSGSTSSVGGISGEWNFAVNPRSTISDRRAPVGVPSPPMRC
jgi:hypothetical protein